MRNLSQGKILTLNTLLRMEVNGLAVSKAVAKTVGDQKLQDMTEDGIDTCEARMRTIQQFLNGAQGDGSAGSRFS